MKFFKNQHSVIRNSRKYGIINFKLNNDLIIRKALNSIASLWTQRHANSFSKTDSCSKESLATLDIKKRKGKEIFTFLKPQMV
jgi:hypothetical protein